MLDEIQARLRLGSSCAMYGSLSIPIISRCPQRQPRRASREHGRKRRRSGRSPRTWRRKTRKTGPRRPPHLLSPLPQLRCFCRHLQRTWRRWRRMADRPHCELREAREGRQAAWSHQRPRRRCCAPCGSCPSRGCSPPRGRSGPQQQQQPPTRPGTTKGHPRCAEPQASRAAAVRGAAREATRPTLSAAPSARAAAFRGWAW